MGGAIQPATPLQVQVAHQKEAVPSNLSVKYIFKYINKGQDSVNVRLEVMEHQALGDNPRLVLLLTTAKRNLNLGVH